MPTYLHGAERHNRDISASTAPRQPANQKMPLPRNAKPRPSKVLLKPAKRDNMLSIASTSPHRPARPDEHSAFKPAPAPDALSRQPANRQPARCRRQSDNSSVRVKQTMPHTEARPSAYKFTKVPNSLLSQPCVREAHNNVQKLRTHNNSRKHDHLLLGATQRLQAAV